MVGGVLEQDALAGHALRRQPAFPSTLGHRLPTTWTVSRAEAVFVEQMGQGTTCGSVCFFPLALVMHDHASLRVRFGVST